MSTHIEERDGRTVVELEYGPAPVVHAFLHDPSLVTGYFGPLGAGKTTAGVMKAAAIYAQAWSGARIAVIRDTWPNLRDTTQKTFFEWFPEAVAGEYLRTSRTYMLRTAGAPAELLFRAMDDREDIANVLSLDLAAAWIDEPQGGLALREGGGVGHDPGLDHELYLSIVARVGRQRGYRPMLWLTGNPPSPAHWIAKEFRYSGRGVPTNPRPGHRLYLGDQETNRAHLRPGYYEDLEGLFGTGTPMARRFLHGEWIEFAQLAPFRAESLETWADRPEFRDLFIAVGVDPAISVKDSASRTAMVVVGQPRQGLRTQAYVLKSVAGHWTAYEQADRLLGLIREFRPQRIRIEDVGWQRALKAIVEREAQLRGIALPFVDLAKPEGDKLRRANAVSGLVESGRVKFGGPGANDLMAALLAVPHDRTAWDLVDAFGLALGGLPPTRAERTPIRSADAAPASRPGTSYAVKPTASTDDRPRPTHAGSREWAVPAPAYVRGAGWRRPEARPRGRRPRSIWAPLGSRTTG